MRNEKKDNSGITLIALVIMIIVLLILAGVTLTFVLGPNGIIGRAKEAKTQTEQRSKEEQDSLAALLGELNSMIGQIEKVKDENPGVLEVDSDNSNILYISSVEDLVAFSNEVSSGNTYEGYTIKLVQSLDFQSDLSYVDLATTAFGDVNNDTQTEGLLIELGKAEGFTPIGVDETICFKGTFDGQNNTLYHVQIASKEKQNVGLFGYLDGSIKQLKLEQGNISGDNLILDLYMGAFCGLNNGTIQNCYNIDTVVTTKNAKQYARGGGIAGRSYGMITSCYNKGSVLSAGNATDSVQLAGIVTENRTTGKVSNCINEGNIKANSITSDNIYSGGIIAYSEAVCENSYNTGIIEASGESNLVCSGGIAASNGNSTGLMKNCYNIGKINVSGTGTVLRAGGACGNLVGQVINCYNLGEISIIPEATGDYIQAGGIATNSTNKGVIINSFNKGSIRVQGGTKDRIYLAGICGYFPGKMINCYNQGDLIVSDLTAKISIQMGGLIGSTDSEGSANNCYTTGKIMKTNVTGTAYVGQMFGINGNETTSNSYYMQGEYPGIGTGPTIGTSMTKEQMKASTFLEALNNNLNSSETEEPLARWKQNENEYPIFE